MFRQAISEIDSDRVSLSSIAPLEEKDEQEITAVLALIDAIKKNEHWVSKHLVEAGKGTANSVGSEDKSSGGGKAQKRKTTKGGKVESPPPPTSTPPSHKIAKLIRDEAIEETPSTFGRTLNEHIRVLLSEMNRVERELTHVVSISAIASALKNGAVRGEVGHIDIEATDYSTLPNVMSMHVPNVLMNQSIKLLLEDADLLVQLRKMIRFQDWDEIERLLEPIVEIDPYFKSCHTNCREELLLISMELVDYMCKKRLNYAIKAGKMEIRTTECKSVSSEPRGFDLLELQPVASSGDGKDVDSIVKEAQARLRDAIHAAEDARYQSEEVRQLLFDAKVSYALHDAVYANRWEPSLPKGTLTWGKLSMEELARLLCAGKAAEVNQNSTVNGVDFAAPSCLCESDPIMTVIGKQLVKTEREETIPNSSGAVPPPPTSLRANIPSHGSKSAPSSTCCR